MFFLVFFTVEYVASNLNPIFETYVYIYIYVIVCVWYIFTKKGFRGEIISVYFSSLARKTKQK